METTAKEEQKTLYLSFPKFSGKRQVGNQFPKVIDEETCIIKGGKIQ